MYRLSGDQNGYTAPSVPSSRCAVRASSRRTQSRMMRSGPLQGAKRLARHLWRMCFALFIAALSIFIGQADVIPEQFRNRGFLALPVLAVLVTMLYWLWRVRRKRAIRGVVAVNAAQDAKARRVAA